MTAQMHAAQRAGFVEMRKRAFQAFAALAQQALPSGTTNAPTVAIDRGASRRLAEPVPSAAIGLREVGPDADGLQVHQHLITVIPLVGDQQRLVKTGGRLVKHVRYYWLSAEASPRTGVGADDSPPATAGVLAPAARQPAGTGSAQTWQNEDTREERCRRNALNARAASPLHVSTG